MTGKDDELQTGKLWVEGQISRVAKSRGLQLASVEWIRNPAWGDEEHGSSGPRWGLVIEDARTQESARAVISRVDLCDVAHAENQDVRTRVGNQIGRIVQGLAPR